jgi:hypothetical protein
MERIERAWAAPATDSAHRALVAAARPYAEQSAAEQLAAAVARRPRFYAAMRAPSLALDTARALRTALDAVARRLVARYPDAVLPPVHVLVGRLTTGGAASASGVLVGGEMYAADGATPRDELSPWERGGLRTPGDIPRWRTCSRRRRAARVARARPRPRCSPPRSTRGAPRSWPTCSSGRARPTRTGWRTSGGCGPSSSPSCAAPT